MQFIFDVAAILRAVLWPSVVLLLLIVYYNKIPDLIRGVAGRVTKLQFSGISIDLASAKPFAPDWSSPNALDLRNNATALQVTDSTAGTFLDQLREDGTADYAEINLGDGEQWLTSRLFIIAILYARMKGIQHFVFLEKSGNVRKRYVGCAEASKIRWALARRFPWFEQAYAAAYAFSMNGGNLPTLPDPPHIKIVNNQGRIGAPYAPNDPGPSLELLSEYLRLVQMPPVGVLMPPNEQDWVRIDTATDTWEHALWLNADTLEALLGDDLDTTMLRATPWQAKSRQAQIQQLLDQPGDFVALVSDEQRLENLVNRQLLLEQVAAALKE